MQVNVEDLSSVKKRIEVELPAEQVRGELDRAYQGLQRKVRLKGFRRGKVPRQVLERYFGEQVRGEVAAELIARCYRQVVEDQKLEVVADPEITTERVSGDEGLRFTATVEVRPQLEVRDYLGLTVERVPVSVDDGEVEKQLARLREAHAQMVVIEDRDTVKEGDLVVIDYTGISRGRQLPGSSARDRVVQVGSGNLPAEFEKQLVGMKRGEAKRIEVEFPSSHSNPSLAGQKLVFRVELKQIGRKELPALDDEFAKDCGEVASLEELREKIRAEVEAQGERLAQRAMRDQLVEQLVERNRVEVPESMVERRLDTMLRELGLAAGSQTRLDQSGNERVKQLRSKLREQALRDVRSALLLEEVARQEGVEVSDEEVKERVTVYADTGLQSRAAMEKVYQSEAAREQVRSHLRQEKALDRLLAGASIIEAQNDAQVIAEEEKKS